jgi:alanyl-tRNA synthetase
MLTGNEIRRAFLDFFAHNGHRIVRSSPLVPIGDPTLLFTNAGMNQFKDVFLGLEQRDYKRAASTQKCVRAGGKHNDLENVGFTNRHLTFFEMLGNFSFGDYFKKEAIAFAWELLTSAKWFAVPKDLLYVTIFDGSFPGLVAAPDMDRDEEAYKAWISQAVPADRIFELGAESNFWAMGDTGPCGPCSEIFYDMGPRASDQGHPDCKFPCDCGRYVEIWNLVFMEFNREPGVFRLLEKRSIDTGAGLERLAAVLQDKVSNFETDLFRPLIEEAARLTGLDPQDGDDQISLRIIADHSRAATFLISDGVVPSNEGRGYVLRRIISRALLNVGPPETSPQNVLPEMADTVARQMKEVYPELLENIGRIRSALESEASRYSRTMSAGLKRFAERAQELNRLTPGVEKKGDGGMILRPVVFPGADAFQMYDTYGLPREIMTGASRLYGVDIDWGGFEHAMEEQRERGRASWKGAHKEAPKPVYTQIASAFRTEPDFYFESTGRDCRIEAIVKAGTSVGTIFAGEEAEVILDRTPIYAESGGQVADVGALYDQSESLQIAEVRGAYYPIAGLIAHRILAKEDIKVGDRVAVVADAARREHIKRNHTATHLMHAALRNILGTHVKQAGSLVAADRLRFDFSHFAPVDSAELTDIEQQVNEHIRQNTELETDITTLDDALASGALAFFGDRYPEQNVRVVTIPDPGSPRGFYSKELCGGTHVRRSGDIGVFKIAVEQSVASGIRRIEALTGEGALADYQRTKELLAELAARLNVGEGEVNEALERLTRAQKQAEKQLEAAQRKSAISKLDTLLEHKREVKGGVAVLSAQVEGLTREGLRELVDPLRQKMGPGVFVLAAVEDGRVALLSSVTRDLTNRLHAGKIIQSVVKELGGQGGGRPDLAEAGGKDTSNLKTALDRVYPLVEGMLSSSER